MKEMDEMVMERITPAYAGTTSGCSDGEALEEDHPRLRGNHQNPLPTSCWMAGSPPLTREPRLTGKVKNLCDRITPAYAGTTKMKVAKIGNQKDHPRLRGNHRFLLIHSFPVIGSPPLTREPRPVLNLNVACFRITPAYAGTTAYLL